MEQDTAHYSLRLKPNKENTHTDNVLHVHVTCEREHSGTLMHSLNTLLLTVTKYTITHLSV